MKANFSILFPYTESNCSLLAVFFSWACGIDFIVCYAACSHSLIRKFPFASTKRFIGRTLRFLTAFTAQAVSPFLDD